MKYIFFILTLTFSLFSQYEWSEPIQLSEDGNYPETTNSFPAITIDSNGVIYAFWIRWIETEDPFVWRGHIEFRKSANGGLTWTEIVNITPENTEKLYFTKAVCDSQNNVHIVYESESNRIYYKKYNGIEWSDQVEVSTCNNLINMKIDLNDRLYVLFWSPTQTYYAYHEASDTNTADWTVSCISAYENMYMKDFTFDADKNIHAVGEYYIYALDEYRPFYMKYDRSRERWGTMHLMDYINEYSQATAIVLTSDGILKAVITYGDNSGYNNNNYLYELSQTDSLWQNKGHINSNTSVNKQMILDRWDRLHLFETKHYECLLYTYTKDSLWAGESIIETDSVFNYSSPYVAFDLAGKFYTVYRKTRMEDNYNYIYFQSRQIDSGINEQEMILPATATLNQNYPNPFNNETEITFSVPDNSEIKLNIYNTKGEFVDELINKKINKGLHTVKFNTSNFNTGIYFYQLVVNGKIVQTKSMLYLK
ncbi:MAG TPA: T9SS type A sorting domain-containing protein [Clostridiales bacterium]|nr:T9SS type A sorting domain-containing protein [Clostridiales bacterium]HQP70955.1 T9SS type A sorting domain-containing protein [Clostridiales bacterium]